MYNFQNRENTSMLGLKVISWYSVKVGKKKKITKNTKKEIIWLIVLHWQWLFNVLLSKLRNCKKAWSSSLPRRGIKSPILHSRAGELSASSSVRCALKRGKIIVERAQSGFYFLNRYKKNAEVLKEEMLKMRFEQLHSDCENPNGYLVTSFKYPDIPQFIYSEFCARLDDAGTISTCSSD